MIDIVNRQRLIAVDARVIRDLAIQVLNVAAPSKGISPHASLSVAFVRDPAIRKLNRDYRGKNRETDVLSFPAGRDEQPDPEGPHGKEYIGDVVISTDTAARQADEAAISIEREIQELVLHGVLHLCGYDHESDRGQMNRLELRLRRKLLDRLEGTRKRPASS